MKPPIDDTQARAVMLMVKVPDGKESEYVKRLHPLVLDRQWDPVWSIRRIYAADLRQSKRQAGPHGPGDHNLFIVVKATDKPAVDQAIPIIRKNLGKGHTIPRGHVLLGAMDMNGPG